MVDSLRKNIAIQLGKWVELYCQLEMKYISSSYSNQSSETVKQTKNVETVDDFAAGN